MVKFAPTRFVESDVFQFLQDVEVGFLLRIKYVVIWVFYVWETKQRVETIHARFFTLK